MAVLVQEGVDAMNAIDQFLPQGVEILRDRGIVVQPSDVGRVLDAFLASVPVQDAEQTLAAVREVFARMDAMEPEDFKTGQDHLPPAFREINFRDAFFALAKLCNEAGELLKDET